MERLTAVAQRAPGRWQIGTVTRITRETPRVASFRIALPMWLAHLPGQHYDVRLTAPDGYQAQRSYSVASSPLDEGEVELTIDRLEDGEVSPYFHDVVVEGDRVEVRESSRKSDFFKNARETMRGAQRPDWLSVDSDKLEGNVTTLPRREHMPVELNEQLVVEYYSR